MVKMRLTSTVRIRMPTLRSLQALSRHEREDMVDLLDLAVILLGRELAKDERTVGPPKKTAFQHVLPRASEVEVTRQRAVEVEVEITKKAKAVEEQ